jgi:hypothetical protein
MKKLALALVCFASVAFFASCQQEITNPEPTISVITDEGFVKNGDVIDVEQTIVYGFQMASNSQTKKELQQLRLSTTFVDLEGNESTPEEEIISLVGNTEYRFADTVYYEITREIIGTIKTVATVTDVDGKVNTATLTLNLNQPAQPLEETDFDWYRLGNTQTGLAEYGLFWEKNAKSPFAQIKPLEGVTLYKFDADKWEATTTDVEKAALFSDVTITSSVYNNVDVNQNGTYNDVIGTKMADGTLHLLHVTSCTIGAQEAQGRPIHIYGQAK